MSLVDILRKLGILRYGSASGSYTSARDMPTELFMDNVYDVKKDLVHKSDFRSPTAPPTPPQFCTHCGAALAQGARFCTSCGQPVANAPSPNPTPPAPGAPLSPLPPRGGIGCGKLLLIFLALGFFGFLGLIILAYMVGDTKPSSNERTSVATVAAVVATPPAPAMPAPSVPAAATSAPKPAQPPEMQFARYPNPKFGFQTELPAHWDSEVKNNSHVFSAPKGDPGEGATINFQFIHKTGDDTLEKQGDELISQLGASSGFKLHSRERITIGGRTALRILLEFKADNGSLYGQDWIIVEKAPYFYWVGYTAPESIFVPYHPAAQRAFSAFRFTD